MSRQYRWRPKRQRKGLDAGCDKLSVGYSKPLLTSYLCERARDPEGRLPEAHDGVAAAFYRGETQAKTFMKTAEGGPSGVWDGGRSGLGEVLCPEIIPGRRYRGRMPNSIKRRHNERMRMNEMRLHLLQEERVSQLSPATRGKGAHGGYTKLKGTFRRKTCGRSSVSAVVVSVSTMYE